MNTVSEGIPQQRSSESLRVTRRTKAIVIAAAALSLAACTGKASGREGSDAPSHQPAATAKANTTHTTAASKGATKSACPPGTTYEVSKRYSQNSIPQTSLVAQAIRLGSEACHSRLVIQLDSANPKERPSIYARYVPRPITSDAEGKTIPVSGNAILQLTLRGASAHNSKGEPTTSQHIENTRGGDITEVVKMGDNENTLNYAIGVHSKKFIAISEQSETPNCPAAECVIVDFIN